MSFNPICCKPPPPSVFEMMSPDDAEVVDNDGDTDRDDGDTLAVVVEIYENERFWLGRGFSKSGLLPTERAPHSTEDGSLGWKTIDEAASAMLLGPERRGWSYRKIGDDENEEAGAFARSAFVPCCGAEDGPTDAEGWAYMPEFAPGARPSARRGMLDFVRRRKLRGTAYFRPDHFLPRRIYEKCDYCDSKAVDLLSNSMLDALSLSTLFLTGAGNNGGGSKPLTDARVLPLKAKLIDELGIGKSASHDEAEAEIDPWTVIYRTRDRLAAFPENVVGKPGPLFDLFYPDKTSPASMASAMPERRRALEQRHFPPNERMALARSIVRYIDRDAHELHCRDSRCSEKNDPCAHRIVVCPHDGCRVRQSRARRDEHDAVCPRKVLPCVNGCQVQVPRGEMDAHVRELCNLRAAECPLKMVGCNAVVQAQDVAAHLNERGDRHFVLIANRMMEYQELFKKMNARMNALEERNTYLERELQRKAAEFASKKDAQATSIQVNKLTKQLGLLEGTVKAQSKATVKAK